jgi:hypothetical protein
MQINFKREIKLITHQSKRGYVYQLQAWLQNLDWPFILLCLVFVLLYLLYLPFVLLLIYN